MPPGPNQPQLDGVSAPTVSWRDDFVGLFGSSLVMPTPVRVLEQGESLLFIHHYPWQRDVPKMHDRLYRLLARYGKSPDGPGTITVVCVWGLANTHREMLVYDESGRRERQALTSEELRMFLADWWTRHKRHGR